MRTGKKHEPHYRIVAQDSRFFRSGKVLEEIGYYNPRTSPSTLTYKIDILKKWMERGAQLSDTVNDLLVKEGIVKQSTSRSAQIKAKIAQSKKNKQEKPAEAQPKTADSPETSVSPDSPETPVATGIPETPSSKDASEPKPEEKLTDTKQEEKEGAKPAEEKPVSPAPSPDKPLAAEAKEKVAEEKTDEKK